MIIRDLSFSYENKCIFDGFSLELNGSKNCIMGESGSGKTTLLFLIGGLLKPNWGEIFPVPLKPAFVFQEDRLLPWYDVLKNVMIVRKDQNLERALSLLEKLEIEPHLKIGELSGGMKRRVSLARALYYKGDLLLLDEPFNGLDERIRDISAGMILDEGIPFLLTTHSIDHAESLGADISYID